MRLELLVRAGATICTLTLLLHIAPIAKADEASFASEAAKWGPTFYATTVLAPKDGAAKFCTFQRGGVQTIYTSEVVGHSPLTPLRAKLSPHFDQGIMVGFATGAALDYRSGPVVHEQALQDGHLPIVITKWKGNVRRATR